MPTTNKQQRAAGAELSRRRRGVKKQKKHKETRPFGSATLRTVKDFATKKRKN